MNVLLYFFEELTRHLRSKIRNIMILDESSYFPWVHWPVPYYKSGLLALFQLPLSPYSNDGFHFFALDFLVQTPSINPSLVLPFSKLLPLERTIIDAFEHRDIRCKE